MGIPGLFANLYKQYGKHVVYNKRSVPDTDNMDSHIKTGSIANNADALYFDYNCLIHPVNRLLWNDYNERPHESKTDFESELIEQSISYMERIIEYANPKEFVAIYIDGVCPLAKMDQQRQRRFASIVDKEIMNNIRAKNSINKEEYYDTNAITPGTVFMEKFHKRFMEYVKKWNESHKVKMLYSSYHEKSEGEHKIIQHIRNNMKNKNIVIYGLDADLIILSMTIKNNNMLLLRESESINVDDLKLTTSKMQKVIDMGLIYFNVKECERCLSHSLTDSSIDNEKEEFKISLESHETNTRLVDDFVFITLLLGNDFIPPCPTLNMRFKWGKLNGYKQLIDVYKLLRRTPELNDKYMVDVANKKVSVNWPMFTELINMLANFEEEFFVNQKSYRNHAKCQSENASAIQIFRMENLQFKHPDPLDMGNEDIPYEERKSRFIHHYYGSNYCNCIDNSSKNKNDVILSSLLAINVEMTDGYYNDKKFIVNEGNYDNVMKDYLKTLLFIMYYYYYECPDNKYSYKHSNAVLLTDLTKFMRNLQIEDLDELDTFYDNTIYTPITPLMQLLYVLPPKSYALLPQTVKRELINGKDRMITIYKRSLPNKPKRDMLHKTKLFQCPITMSMPDIELIRVILADIKVTEEDAERNKLI